MAATFTYKGIKGTKYVDGRIAALNKDEAAYKLTEDKVIITFLEKVSGKEESDKEDKKEKKKKRISKKVPVHEVIVFTKKLETMIRAGLPILETIAMIVKQTTHLGLKVVVGGIHEAIESGTPLSDAFAKYPQVFDTIYINLLRAGESSGKVDLFLQKLVVSIEKDQKIKASIKGAMSYPIILLIVALAVVGLMMVFVVPVFQDMFSSVEGGLPATTQIVVDISAFLRDPLKGGTMVGIIVFTIFALKLMIKRSFKFRRSWHKLVLKLPLFGELIRKSSLSKIAMIQGNLTAAGVPVIEALDISSSSNTNIIIQEAMTDVKKGVFSGDPLSTLFEKTPSIFESSFTSMVNVGERTGNMEEMFGSISGYYEEEMDITIGKLTAMLEPIMIVFMGATVGFILVAMYTPMFAMGQTL